MISRRFLLPPTAYAHSTTDTDDKSHGAPTLPPGTAQRSFERPVVRLVSVGTCGPFTTGTLFSVLRRGRYDVAVVWMSGYNSITYLLGAATQRAMGGPILFREEQTLLDPRPLTNALVKHGALRLLFSQGRALYISSENRRWFQHFGVPEERL